MGDLLILLAPVMLWGGGWWWFNWLGNRALSREEHRVRGILAKHRAHAPR